jgi:hypothetical protein
MSIIRFGFVAWIACAAASAAADEQALKQQLSGIEQQNGAVLDEYKRLLAQGDADAAVKRLRAGVGESSPAHALFLGNWLYEIDAKQSYALHRAAAEKLPGESLALFEWGLEQQRAGEWAQAASTWRALLKPHPNPVASALLAECLIHAGDLAGAAAAWTAADHASRHVEIEQAIGWVHGKLSPQRRRADLWKRLRAGDAQAAAAIVRLDAEWDDDWWNADVNREALERDLAALVPPLVPKETAAELQRFAQVVRADSVEARRAALTGAGWLLGAKAGLPRASTLAEIVVERAVDDKLITIKELLRFEPELRRRAIPPARDVDALNLLANLLQHERPADLAAIDQLGWEKYGDARFAGSLFWEAAMANKLDASDAKLARAIAQFPSSAALRRAALEVADAKTHKQRLVDAITAEFADPMGLTAPRDSYLLNLYFLQLADALK